MSILSERPKDCLGCKLISGFGLIGAGLYVMSNARKFSGFQKGSMMTLASCIYLYSQPENFHIEL